MANDGKATIMDVMRYFEYDTAAAFRKDWSALTPADKTALQSGIGDGTLTY